MRWTVETISERKQRLSNWHRWFAWYPVTVYNHQKNCHQRVWLESVWRKGQWRIGLLDNYWIWSHSIQSYVEINKCTDFVL